MDEALTVQETVAEIGAGGSDAATVLEQALGRIAEHDPRLNAFSVVLAERARAEAAERDALPEAERGPLHGVPVAVKEEIDVAGCVTTFGGEANTTPAAADGEVVRRLRAAGAVIVGKTTMPEFGAFPYTESASRGLTRNPWDPTRTPGGSSGGTAAALASGMVPVAIGGDGGGSIRIPAACCGLFGLKPQRGRVTTAPHEHLWWSLGTVGPLSRTVLDSAVVYDVIRGSPPPTASGPGRPAPSPRRRSGQPGRLRIGWSAKPVTLGVKPDPIHVRALEETARLLARPGSRRAPGRPSLPRPDGGVRAAVLRRSSAPRPTQVEHFEPPRAAYP